MSITNLVPAVRATVVTWPTHHPLFADSWRRFGWDIDVLLTGDPVPKQMREGGGLFVEPEVINYGFTPGDVYSPLFTSFDPGRKAYALFGNEAQWQGIWELLYGWDDKRATLDQVLARVGNNRVHVQPDGVEYLQPGWSRSKLVWFSAASRAVNGFSDLAQCVNFVRPVK